MKKKIKNYNNQMKDNFEVKSEYLKRLEEIRNGRFIKVNDFSKRY